MASDAKAKDEYSQNQTISANDIPEEWNHIASNVKEGSLLYRLSPYVLGISIILSGLGVSLALYEIMGTKTRLPELLGTLWTLFALLSVSHYEQLIINEYNSKNNKLGNG